MEALKNVVDNYGVTHMAAICAICKSQFSKVFPYYDFRMDQIISLHQLVSNAIVLQPEGDVSEILTKIIKPKRLKSLSDFKI